MSAGREMAQLARKVDDTPGWSAEKRKRGHWCFRGPGGVQLFASSTPGDRRGHVNARAMLRRSGWDES